MSTTTTVIKPPDPPGPLRWLKRNLFSSWYNSLLTVVAAVFVVAALKGIFTWVLFEANWAPVTHSLRLFAVGQFPPDQLWRVKTIAG